MGIPKITQMAINAALSGGGKREGTAVPVGVPVERIFFNLNNTVEETDAILSQLTYGDIGDGTEIYAVCANTTDGNLGSFVFVNRYHTGIKYAYYICVASNVADNIITQFYVNELDPEEGYNGWVPALANPDVKLNLAIAGGVRLRVDGIPLTDFLGLPIGAENEKIKNVLSITPF